MIVVHSGSQLLIECLPIEVMPFKSTDALGTHVHIGTNRCNGLEHTGKRINGCNSLLT
jgi:hypothetical protein